MTGQNRARAFLESITGYGEPGHEQDSRPVRLATIDPDDTGVGMPQVLFDGETVMGLRGYPWIGTRPAAGERVAMLPQGRSYIILGAVHTGG